MKIEFRNTPVYFRGNAFSEFKIQNTQHIQPQVISKPEMKSDEVVISNKKKITIGAAATAGLGGLVWIGNLLRGKGKTKIKPDVQVSTEVPVEIQQQVAQTVQTGLDVLKSGFKTLMDAFPDDFNYIKTLAKNLGLKEGEEFKLNSVMGKTQLKKLLDDFTAEDFAVGREFEGAKNLTYRVNIHNHTTFSDGKMSVEEFLEQARRYADKVAEKNSADNKPPFLIAITDHDTMEGCKEALKILSDNPEKYKNLKVVFGSEISVSNSDANIVSRPLNFELLGYGLNPYDEKLAKLLENIQKTRQENVEKYLQELKAKFPQYELNINEAKDFHSNLRTMRTNGVLYLAGDYAKFKIALSEYVKKINEILPENAEKLLPEKLFKQFSEEYYYRMDSFGEKNIKEYFQKHGLRDYLSKKGFLTGENEQAFDKIFETDLSEKNKFISETVQKNLPTLSDRKNYTLSPEQVFEATTEGFYGFAHPAVIDFAYDNISPARRELCDKNSYNYSQNLVFEIFNSLKKSGKELFAASEIHYQSYPENVDKNWIEFMKTSIADNPALNLQYTGGVDCHKPSIFLKHQYLDEKIFKEILGE